MFFSATKLKWFSFSYLIACITVYSNAQITQTKRIEIPILQNFESQNAIALDTSGIVVYRSFTNEVGSELELTRVDTTLATVWKGAVPVPNGFALIKTKAANGKVYFFFSGEPKSLNYLVIIANPKDGSNSTFFVQNQVPIKSAAFVATNDAILIAGYFNLSPVVLHYSLVAGTSRFLPGFLNEPGELDQIKTNQDGSVDVVINTKNTSRHKCILIKRFDKAGDLIKTVAVEPDENKNLISARILNLSDNSQIVAGAYGRNEPYARGVFVAAINPLGEYVIHYYNFSDLKNFFHYMNGKEEQWIKKRIERRNAKGKKTKFDYRLMVHELIPFNDQFVMLSESFSPHYSSQSGAGDLQRARLVAPMVPLLSSPSVVRSGMTNRYGPIRPKAVFDGYQYTHAIAIGFDKNANLIWDNSLEINDIKVFKLEQFVKILAAEDHILMAYLFENKLRTKIIHGDQVIENTTQNPIKTYDGQEGVDIQQGKLEYWYSNHFSVYGIQTVRSTEGTHKVFFINKLRAH